MYPKLTINTKKITENARWVVDQCKKSGISVVGINNDDAVEAVGEVLRLPHLDFAGIGVNLSCTGAIVPTLKTYEKFGAIQGAITERYGISCPFASGGASSTFYMVEDGSIPSCINNLRIGELILYGNDVSGHRRHPLLHHDAFILSAEVVEVKDKRAGLHAFTSPYITQEVLD